MRIILYRNIAVFFGIVIILNVVLFQHVDLFSSVSVLIELIIVLFINDFWYTLDIGNRVVLMSLVLYFIGYSFETFL